MKALVIEPFTIEEVATEEIGRGATAEVTFGNISCRRSGRQRVGSISTICRITREVVTTVAVTTIAAVVVQKKRISCYSSGTCRNSKRTLDIAV